MEIKILVPCFLLLLSLVKAQNHQFKSYDWRTTGRMQEWPKVTSLLPYGHQAPTEKYPVLDQSRHYPVPSSAYHDDSFSAELPYSNVDQSISSSYENYENVHHDDQFNMTMARIGGFAGSGDTRGYGAYDYPKNHHPEPHHSEYPEPHHSVHPEPHHSVHSEHPEMHHELKDLLRIGRNHRAGYPNPDSMLIHPLPPPL